MVNTYTSILRDPDVRAALAQSWSDSRPGFAGGHEEGGFILEDGAGSLIVVRWPTGEQGSIRALPHQNCRIDGLPIVASFHTYPNTGPDYLQAPSETDRRTVRDDPDLKGPEYIGEFVIAATTIYLIEMAGSVREVAATADLYA